MQRMLLVWIFSLRGNPNQSLNRAGIGSIIFHGPQRVNHLSERRKRSLFTKTNCDREVTAGKENAVA